MRIGFVTCVELGLACLEEIESLGGRLDLLVTLGDEVAPRKSGRVFLDDYARRTETPLVKTRIINDPDCVAAIRQARLDYLLVIGWSQILQPEVLTAVSRQVFGMHPTLLPVGRGRAPIPWTILKGLEETGVTAFQIATEVDNGAIAGQVRFAVSKDETATTLYAKSVAAHRSLMRDLWPKLCSGSVKLVPQDDSRATHWPGRRPADGEIRPEMSVVEVERLVRATTHPYPGAFLRRDGRKLIVWSGAPATSGVTPGLVISCADGDYIAHDIELAEPD